MTGLLLKRAKLSRPSGQWQDEDYDVLSDDKVVGRIYEQGGVREPPELRWTTIVVVAGVLFLFIPGAFQAIPARVRDGRAGLAIAGLVLIAALGVLGCVATGAHAL